MKILLVNPPACHVLAEADQGDNESYVDREEYGLYPPLGLLYVITYCEQNTEGHEFYFKDCVAEDVNHAQFKQYIDKIKPDICGITSFTISLVDVCMAAESARAANPDCHICLGGHHPIAFPAQAVELPNFDSIIVGEGEYAFTELVKKLENRQDYTDILGVYNRESMQKHLSKQFRDKRFLSNVNVPASYVDDVNKLPFPDRKYIQDIKYVSTVGKTDNLCTIVSTRGCPYLCTFCDVPYKKYRTRTIENVVDEVEACLKLGYKEFHFYDDLFNITTRKVIDFCDEVERRKLKFNWYFRGRVNAVTLDSLERAKRAGCYMISFGVETGSDYGLKYLKKRTTVAKIRQVFEWMNQVKIDSIANFIIGFPFEKTPQDIRDNVNFLINLKPDYAQFGVLMLLPNTPIFDEGVKKGLANPQDWEEFAKNPTKDFKITHWTEHMDMDTPVKLQKESWRKFYFRPKQIMKDIWRTRTYEHFKMKAKAAITLLTN